MLGYFHNQKPWLLFFVLIIYPRIINLSINFYIFNIFKSFIISLYTQKGLEFQVPFGWSFPTVFHDLYYQKEWHLSNSIVI